MTETPDVAQEIQREYEAGDGMTVIASRRGMSVSAVRTKLIATGTAIRQPTPVGTTPDLDLQIQRAYKNGLSVQRVARAFGLSRKVVRASLRRTGTTMRPRHRPQRDIAAAWEMRREYDAGESVATIASRRGVSATTVRSALHAVGTEIRRPQPPDALSPLVTHKILRVYRTGLSVRATAAEAGVSYTVAEAVLRSHDAIRVGHHHPAQNRHHRWTGDLTPVTDTSTPDEIMAAVADSLGRLIRTMRVERGWTRPELAERIAFRPSEPVVLTWEHGHRTMTVAKLVLIARTFGVPAADMLQSAVQAVGIDRMHLLVDLAAVVDEPPATARDLAVRRWASRRLAAGGDQLVRLTPEALTEMAAMIGCTPRDLADDLAQYTPTHGESQDTNEIGSAQDH